MKICFESMGRKFEGDEPKGRSAIDLFHVSAAIVADIEIIGADAGESVAASVFRFAGHKNGEQAAKITLDGFTCDGVVISRDTWSELFEKKGAYIDAYAASIRIWKECGFLGGSGI